MKGMSDMNLFELWMTGSMLLILVILAAFVTLISLTVNDTSSKHEKKSRHMKVITASTVAALVLVAVVFVSAFATGQIK